MKGGEWTPHRKSDEPRLADLAISDWGPAGANAEVDAPRGLDDLSRLFPHKSKAHLPETRTSKARTSKARTSKARTSKTPTSKDPQV